jgi:hypothetical protein
LNIEVWSGHKPLSASFTKNHTESSKSYSKEVEPDGEGIQSYRAGEQRVYHGVISNRMYLLGGHFIVVVDHKPLLPLYNDMD